MKDDRLFFRGWGRGVIDGWVDGSDKAEGRRQLKGRRRRGGSLSN